jgi:hypothetical protein
MSRLSSGWEPHSLFNFACYRNIGVNAAAFIFILIVAGIAVIALIALMADD